MTNQERIDNVTSLGYTPAEAAFISLAALHSGYFLRRQYSAFTGKTRGGADEALTSKLLRRGHAKELEIRNWRRIYSIASKSLFEALGEVDNRNRRLHEPQTIRARLMSLDFVIRHPHVTWFPTEGERIRLFTEQLGIEREHLPVWRYASKDGGAVTLRWFVDKPPIYTSESDPAIHFCFADPGFHTVDSFSSFLRNYRPLFARLRGFEVIYIAEVSHAAERARRVFQAFFSKAGAAPKDPLLADLLTYFRDRSEHESSGLRGFDRERIDRYRDARKQFSSERFQRMFEVWMRDGREAVGHALSPESSDRIEAAGTFSVCLSERNFARSDRTSGHTPRSGACSGPSSASVASYA